MRLRRWRGCIRYKMVVTLVRVYEVVTMVFLGGVRLTIGVAVGSFISCAARQSVSSCLCRVPLSAHARPYSASGIKSQSMAVSWKTGSFIPKQLATAMENQHPHYVSIKATKSMKPIN